VSRGVFDRGTGNTFIYEVDLTKDSWPLEKRITGAFKTWLQDVESVKLNQKTINRLAASQGTQFISSQGVLWKRIKTGIEELAYCPVCKLAMSSWPPDSDEALFCSKCNFIAPFKPSKVPVLAKSVSVEK
jgi:hypothetical protein